jgi:hypothetical protein
MMSSKTSARIPEAVPIDSVKGVGKSWYKRGAQYWLMRAFAATFLLLMTAMIFAIAIGITIGIIQSGAPAWIVVPIVVILSVSSSIMNAKAIVRKQQEQLSAAEDDFTSADSRASSQRSHNRRISAGSGAVGFAASALGGFGAFIMAICVPIAVGVIPVTLWYWLQPLVPGEYRARRKVIKWLTVMGREDEIPVDWHRTAATSR